MHAVRRLWSAVVGPSDWRSVIGPIAFALVAIALLIYDHVNQRVPALVFWLTLGLIVTAEHFDGSGYPDGLVGEAIPVGARVIAVAVAFAALTERRPHREPISPDEALAELRRAAGSQFDPHIVEALALDLTEEEVPVPAST